MAEQLSSLSYKPWMKGNFSALQINSEDVIAGGSSAYFAPNIVSSAILNPPYSEYVLTFAPNFGSGFTINPDGDGVLCSQAGVYNFVLNVNQAYSSGGSGRWAYRVEIKRKGVVGDYTVDFVGGDSVDSRDSVMRCSVNCTLAVPNDNLLSIRLVQRVSSADINNIQICGSDTLTPSTLLIKRLSDLPVVAP